MNESGLRSLMDSKAREQWDRDINEGKFPDFTRNNLTSTFSRLHDSRGEMFERGVINVFRALSWEYKTNQPFAFGKRVILEWITSPCSGGSGGTIGYANSGKCDQVDDLVRVLSVLDGKPEPDHRNGTWSRVARASRESPPIIDHEYYSARLHRNGNAHLLFKRPELVTKMNAILAKHYPAALAHDRNVTGAKS